MRLIDADALKDNMFGYAPPEMTWDRGDIEHKVDEMPTIEPKREWISVKDKLPEEHESIFHKFLGTPKWSSAMWQQESDKVLVCVSFPDGTRVVTTGCLHNSDWMTTVSKTLPQIVTHWMPLPEPPKEEDD